MATWAPPKPSTTGATQLDRYFHITERGSTVRTEVMAGLATWLTMVYIVFVNPATLGAAGADRTGVALPFGQILTVTALVAGILCLAMGLYANYPFALAAGLGLNAFVAFTLVVGYKLTWREAMGVVVIEGLVITFFVLTGLRETIMNAIPMDLKRAIGIGIGAFIAFIGLSVGCNTPGDGCHGIVLSGGPTTFVALNPNLSTLRVLVFVVGLALTATLVARRVKGSLLFGIVITTIFATLLNHIWGHKAIWPVDAYGATATLPNKWVSAPHFDLVGKFNFGVFDTLAIGTAIAIILAVMLSDFFDTMGTVVGIAGKAGLLDKDGKLPGMNRVLLVDSLGAAAGGAASASSNTTYIESAAGVAEGGRTGLTSIVVGILFLLMLFISPLAGTIPPEATAPVLVLVGYFMMTIVKDIDWQDPAIGIPCLLIIVMMPFTFSITNGVGAGFIAYTVIRILQGRGRDVHWLMLLVSVVFGWYFWHGLLA
jgi:AGZA family xanthine/uracil permease-like MFS transporter